ncbi:hypothetical protein PCASD_25146 [Puccinia coronata f. sp. avenae]|uniref:Uncharacterized protein n=1 Tax=Puccinia coronata f. sp. avenae TaxID=200324 RepID=A0A2N5SI37_9BASI|nr:hypothetical protein PCASD_25146 [Puccinia coronata f. sp. avenae]
MLTQESLAFPGSPHQSDSNHPHQSNSNQEIELVESLTCARNLLGELWNPTY